MPEVFKVEYHLLDPRGEAVDWLDDRTEAVGRAVANNALDPGWRVEKVTRYNDDREPVALSDDAEDDEEEQDTGPEIIGRGVPAPAPGRAIMKGFTSRMVVALKWLAVSTHPELGGLSNGRTRRHAQLTSFNGLPPELRGSDDRPSYACFDALVRRGLVSKVRQGENPLHEPARSWPEYGITAAGLALAAEL